MKVLNPTNSFMNSNQSRACRQKRHLLVTFIVILATLVLQGLTLPLLMRFLTIEIDDSVEHEDAP